MLNMVQARQAVPFCAQSAIITPYQVLQVVNMPCLCWIIMKHSPVFKLCISKRQVGVQIRKKTCINTLCCFDLEVEFYLLQATNLAIWQIAEGPAAVQPTQTNFGKPAQTPPGGVKPPDTPGSIPGSVKK